MTAELKGGVFVDDTPVEEKIAALGNLGRLPIGPTLPIAGQTSLKEKIAKEEARETPPQGA